MENSCSLAGRDLSSPKIPSTSKTFGISCVSFAGTILFPSHCALLCGIIVPARDGFSLYPPHCGCGDQHVLSFAFLLDLRLICSNIYFVLLKEIKYTRQKISVETSSVLHLVPSGILRSMKHIMLSGILSRPQIFVGALIISSLEEKWINISVLWCFVPSVSALTPVKKLNKTKQKHFVEFCV